jgi:hypothetical protein
MITLWLATGLLSGEEQPATQIVGGWGLGVRRKKVSKAVKEEAERQAAEALAAFEEQERQQYLARLDELLKMQPIPADMDARLIALTAQNAVRALIEELAAEFDRYMARLEFERDEEEAVIFLLLAA